MSYFVVEEQRRVLPDISVDFAWVDDRIDVVGPMSKGRPTRYAVGSRILLLSIDPVRAADWLGVPLQHLTDRVVNLAEIDASRARRLSGYLARRTTRPAFSPAFSSLSHSRLSRADCAAKLLSAGWRVAEVANRLNISERQLARSFEHLIGLHPKLFSRIARLRRAILLAKRGSGLARAASEAGFADQAHFTREVRSLTGETPMQILPNVGNLQDLADQHVRSSAASTSRALARAWKTAT